MSQQKIKFDSGLPHESHEGFRPSFNSTQKIKIENKKKIKVKTIEKSSFIIDALGGDNGVYESILLPEKDEAVFICCYKEKNPNCPTKKFALKTFINRESVLESDQTEQWRPKSNTFETLPFYDSEYKTGINETDTKYSVPSQQDLFDRIVSTLNTYVDMQKDFTELCALMVMMSYEQHKFNWVPYLGVFGDTGSGKSVLVELMSHLCYRCGYFTQTNGADIYQFLSEYGDTTPTLAEDETQGFERDTEKIKIYKSGNSKNGKVMRILMTQNGRKLLNFPTYCFKILAGEQVPTVKGLNERTIIINMSKGKPAKNWYDRTKSDWNIISKLKWDLLKWRMMNYENQYPNDIQATTRIENNLKPLRALAKGLAIEKDFENWCNDAILKSQKDKRATIEGCVVESVYVSMQKGSFEIESVLQGQQVTKIYVNFETIWRAFKDATSATEVQLHSEKLQTDDFGEVTKNKIGRILTDIFYSHSLTRRNSNEGKVRFRAFEVETLLRVFGNYFDEEEIKKICDAITERNKKINSISTYLP